MDKQEDALDFSEHHGLGSLGSYLWQLPLQSFLSSTAWLQDRVEMEGIEEVSIADIRADCFVFALKFAMEKISVGTVKQG